MGKAHVIHNWLKVEVKVRWKKHTADLMLCHSESRPPWFIQCVLLIVAERSLHFLWPFPCWLTVLTRRPFVRTTACVTSQLQPLWQYSQPIHLERFIMNAQYVHRWHLKTRVWLCHTPQEYTKFYTGGTWMNHRNNHTGGCWGGGTSCFMNTTSSSQHTGQQPR